MKPIIIKVDKDDNVVMKLEEFRKHMDDAYYQGLKDGEITQWWRYTGPTYYTGTPVTTKTVEITCLDTAATTVNSNDLGTAGTITATF